MADINWLTGRTQLKGNGLEVMIHPRVQLAYVGAVNWIYNARGLCQIYYEPTLDIHRFVLKYMQSKIPEENLYLEAHEEGHAMVLLGQVELMIRQLNAKGFSFNSFTPENGQQLDRITNNFLRLQEEILSFSLLLLIIFLALIIMR